jgi:hypothetical protein
MTYAAGMRIVLSAVFQTSPTAGDGIGGGAARQTRVARGAAKTKIRKSILEIDARPQFSQRRCAPGARGAQRCQSVWCAHCAELFLK